MSEEVDLEKRKEEILKEFEKKDRENQLLEEIDYVFAENDDLEKIQYKTGGTQLSNCSLGIFTVQVNIFVIGPYNRLLIRSLNSFVPDLFRKCWYQKEASVPSICPLISIPPKTYLFFQFNISETLIKSFLYFGFSSDYKTNYNLTKPYPIKNIEFNLLYQFLNNFNNGIYSENWGNFTDFPVFFMSKYPEYTLIYQLVKFYSIISKAKAYSSRGLVGCFGTIEWEATFVCRGGTPLNLATYNPQLDVAFLRNVYDNYQTWLANYFQGRIVLSSFTQSFENFFLVLNYAREVFRDITQQFSYIATQKYYVQPEYMKPQYFQKCLELYQIYTENKKNFPI